MRPRRFPLSWFGVGIDPVEAGFIESLARPGGNLTGITLLTRKLDGKRLELLKRGRSQVSRVAVLYEPADRGTTRDVKEEIPVAARALG